MRTSLRPIRLISVGRAAPAFIGGTVATDPLKSNDARSARRRTVSAAFSRDHERSRGGSHLDTMELFPLADARVADPVTSAQTPQALEISSSASALIAAE